MRKSWRVGPQQLCRSRNRGNRARFGPGSGARDPVTRQRIWRRWGSRRVGPKCRREGYREFRCGRDHCRRWVRICSCCDRGHRYCGQRCARAARRESQRKSQRKYEQKARARRLRAERQRRYRARVLLSDTEQQPDVDESDPKGQAPIQEVSGADEEEAQDAAAASDSSSPDRVDQQKVTHQGSLGSACVSQWRASRIASLRPGFFPVRCCFCGVWCRPERRRGPLRGRQRRRIHPFPGQ